MLKITCWFAIVIVLIGASVARGDIRRKPNVVMIVADDLNTCLSCYGHPLVKTPHLDKLAQRGVRFERAYTQYPICNPSRTSFLSGYRPGAGNKVLLEATWLPMHFSRHGYAVGSVKKVAHTPQMANLCAFPEKRSTKNPLADAQAFLEANKSKPLFLAYGVTQTHPGYQTRPQFVELYPHEKVVWEPEPANIRAGVPPVAFEGYLTQNLGDAERRKHIASYYAAISTLDAEVGALLELLETMGLLENTIILFTSDHGRHLGEHGGIYDKRSLFEESVRVPLIVAAPGKKGGVSSRLVEMIDYYSTLVELAGLPLPKHLEGTSFVPLLDDPRRPWKKAAFSESQVSGTRGRSLRTERWRYTEWDAKNGQLYDHDADPREQVNLYGDPRHATVLAEMRQLLQAGWRAARP